MPLLPRFALVAALLLSAGAAAASAPRPLPVPAADAASMLSVMAKLGMVKPADVRRVTQQHLTRVDAPVASRGSGTTVLRLMRRWLAEQGVPVQTPVPPQTLHVDSTQFPIRVFYDAGRKSQAQTALQYAEAAWQRQVVQLGYRAPHTLGDPDPVQLGMDFYFAASDEWAGLTVPLADIPSTPLCDCSSRMFLNDYLHGSDMATTVEHEFNHATQGATDCGETISAWEGFTTAVESIAYPDDQSNRYMLREFQNWPEFPLDYWSYPSGPGTSGMPDALYQYGAAVFPFFLKDRFANGDPAFLREVWESFKQDGTYDPGFGGCIEGNDPDWMQGLDTLLKTKGSSLPEAFAEFAVWRAVVGRYNDGQHLKNAGYVPAPAVAVIFQGFPVRNYLLVRKWGTRYLEYVPASDSEGPLSITITGRLPALWIGSVMLWRQGQAVEVRPLTFDAKGVASLQTPFLAGIDRVLIAVSQVAGPEYRTDDRDYETAQSFQYSVAQLAGQDAAQPPGPDAAPPGPDAEPAGPDAAPAGPDASLAADAASADADAPAVDSGAAEPVQESEGCGCGAAGGASALLGLFGLGALLARPRSRR